MLHTAAGCAPRTTRPRLALLALLAGAVLLPMATAPVRAATAAEVLADYKRQAGGAAGSAERGEEFFAKTFGTTLGWSCSSCHTKDPTKAGKDDMTAKRIGPMAPAFNPERFTDKNKVENNFRLNCKDVVGRECTAQEKLDVLTWLMSFKR